jgi:serine/threonine-protein kinase RsbT
MSERRIYINNDLDIVVARMQAREMAKQMGFSTADQARISLAASELARVLSWNTSQAGEIVMRDADQNGQHGFQVSCLVNLEQITVGGEAGSVPDKTTVSGKSLAGACQLVDESIVEEQGNNQAQVILIKWLK